MNKAPTTGNKIWGVLACSATVLVLAGTLMPAKHVPTAPVFALDKLIHLVAFGGLTVLWRFASLSAWKTVALMTLLAFGTEFGQHWMQLGRQYELRDLLADGLGVVLGLIVAEAMLRLWRNRAKARSA